METTLLVAALGYCKGSLLNVDLVPALTHFFFENEYVLAYNDTTAVIAPLEHGVTCGLQGDTLLQLLPTLGKVCSFSQLDVDKEVVLKSGKVKITLPALDPDATLFVSPIMEHSSAFYLTQEMAQGLERCCETVSDNAVLRHLSAVEIQVDKSGQLECFSSNDVSLTQFSTLAKWKVKQPAPTTYMVLGSSIRQLLALCNAVSPKKDPIIFLNADWLCANIDEVIFYARMVKDATAPDYRDIIDKKAPTLQRKVPEGFLAALTRAKVLTSKDLTPKVELDVTDTQLVVSAVGTLGSFTDSFSRPKDFPMVKVWLKPEPLAAAAENINTLFGIGVEAVSFGTEGLLRLVSAAKVKE